MQPMTRTPWQRVRATQRRRARQRRYWARTLEALETRTLLSVSSTTDAATEDAASALSLLGDATSDGRFDESDMAQVLQGGKYETGQPAIWSEGDWNQDGVFDSGDLDLALQAGQYLSTSSADVVFEQVGAAAASSNEIVDPASFVWTDRGDH